MTGRSRHVVWSKAYRSDEDGQRKRGEQGGKFSGGSDGNGGMRQSLFP